MLDTLLDIDRELFLFLNSFHTPALDQAMMAISKTMTWAPLYVLLLFFVFKNYGVRSWMVLIAIALTVLIADQVTSSLMKPWFERLRPSHEPALQNLVHIVDGYRGGQYGFASSHAANTFGVAMLFVLMFRNSWRWISLLFIWAVIVSFSRIYLGVHYPGDVVTGWIVGALAAWISYKGLMWTDEYIPRKQPRRTT